MHSAVLRQVGKTYRLDAIDVPEPVEIDLEIYPDRFTENSGPSGSGKTTRLNLIGCIDRPDRGRVVVAGQPVDALPEDALFDFRTRHLGFIFQNFNLQPVLTAYENVEYPLLLAKVPAAQRRRPVLELLDAIGVAVALPIAYLINHSGLTWAPHGYSYAYPVMVRVWDDARLIAGGAVGLVIVAIVSAWWPANRASKMMIADTLRHV